MNLLIDVLNIGTSSVLCYSCYSIFSKLFENKTEIKNIRECTRYTLNDQTKKKFEEALKSKKMVYVEMNRKQTTFNQNTFRKQQKLSWSPQQNISNFQTGTGNSFNYQKNDIKMMIDIRQCKVLKFASDIKTTPFKIPTKNYESYQTHYKTISYSFNPFFVIGVIGSLSFDLNKKMFVLEPKFMFTGLSQQLIFGKIEEYFSDQRMKLYSELTLYSMVLALLAILNHKKIIGFFQNIKSKIINLFGSVSFNNSIDSLSNVTTSGRLKLKCRCGNPMNIIYQCGHLNKCQNCQEKLQNKKCFICAKQSNDFLKIFI